jgi:hypothetical protein
MSREIWVFVWEMRQESQNKVLQFGPVDILEEETKKQRKN